MTDMKTMRRPSPLQRRVLIMLAGIEHNQYPGPGTSAGAGRGRPCVRAAPPRLLPAHGNRGLAARPEHAAGRVLAAPLLANEQARVLAELLRSQRWL